MAKAKEIAGLDCGGAAGSQIALVLATRLEEMLAFRDEALDFASDKGVHDMRVASRRVRSALRDFMPYLNKKRMAEVREELRRVAGILGAVRDEDVAIALLEKLSEEAPEEMRAGIGVFAAKREARREEARRELVEEFAGESLARLREEFTRALAQSAKSRGEESDEDDAEGAALTFAGAGREVILARWRELEKLSRSLYDPFDTEELHDMRIAAKRLRYAVELLTSCLGGDALKPFAEEVAEMQKSLGELHDCDEWVATIGGWLKKDAAREREKGDAEDEEGKGGDERSGVESAGEREAFALRRVAAFWMLDHFMRLRNQHYRDALGRWRDWEGGEFVARLRSVIGAG
ncbi:MAG TPA: CHAD domain-containing protein [Pyrinomonadaceae bacterium]|nr:CHAD domain-containing protein [Pyrinomonadaceae bacterium]